MKINKRIGRNYENTSPLIYVQNNILFHYIKLPNIYNKTLLYENAFSPISKNVVWGRVFSIILKKASSCNFAIRQKGIGFIASFTQEII